MANVPESATFDAGIYQIEITDAVIGGVNGISNLQAKGLANRTTWLKAQVDALNALKGMGIQAFSAGSSYVGGQQAIYQKNIWQANTSISPGAFNPANWTRQLGTAAEIDVATAAQFDSSLKLATTAFVNDAIGGLRRTVYSLTQGQVITPAMVNSMIYAGGTVNSATLPLLSSVPTGSTLTFAAISSSITLLRQGADTIWVTSTNSALTAINVNLGDTLTLVATSFGWVCAGGSAMFAYQGETGVFASLLSSNGYQKLPGGLILQWGSIISGTTPSTFTFPIAFPTAVLNVVVSAAAPSTIGSASLTGIPVTTTSNGIGVYVFAIGK